MTVDFICELLAEWFDSPCNYSPMDEQMFKDNYCESHCGKITDAECWKRYFEKMWADRKTENCSEIPNNCEVKNYCDDCLYTDTCDSKEFFYVCTSKATISKMEQVDKDINVRSKTEPQTIRCPKCGRSDYIREFGKDFSVTAEEAGFKYKCINCNTYIEPQSDRKTESNSEKPNNCETCRFELYCPEMCEGCCEWDSHYEPKDEPQTMVYPQVDGITPSVIAKNEPQITKVGMATDSVTGKVLGVTLDTDCAWK